MPIFLRLILLLLLTGGSWLALERSKIVPTLPLPDQMSEVQRQMHLDFINLNRAVAVPYPHTTIIAVYCFNEDPAEKDRPCPRPGTSDRLNKHGEPVISPSQGATIGSLSVMQKVPWWLWRTSPGEMTYGGYNWYLGNLQEHLLAAAALGLVINLFCRFSLKTGWIGPVFIAVMLPVALSGLYLSPKMNETLSIFTLMFSVSILLTLWPHRKPDPDYSTK